VVDIYPVKFSKARLDTAPEDERLFHLIAGQLANDINCLGKLSILIMNPVGGHQLNDLANTMMAISLIKVLAGKTNEGWKLIEKHSALFKRYRNDLSPDAINKLKEIKKYFNKQPNVIYEIRNKLSFHLDVNNLQRGYASFSSEEVFVDYLSVFTGHCIYYSSEIITIMSMVKMVKTDDWKEALLQIFGEVTRVSSWMGDFILDFMRVFMEKYITIDLYDIEKDKIIVEDGPDIYSVKIPFFCSPPK